MLVIASANELSAGDRIWGTGGWLPPEQREALDWLTLARLMGWNVKVAHPGSASILPADAFGILRSSGTPNICVIACEPDSLTDASVAQFTAQLASEPFVLITRAGRKDGPLARLAGAAQQPQSVSGRSLRWTGAGEQREWHSRKELNAHGLASSDGTSTWATLDGAPIIAARRVGRGTVVSLGFHPSELRDTDGAGTALIRHLLIWSAQPPAPALDWSGTMILRMDDPGGAQNVYLKSFAYAKLREDHWREVGEILENHNARLSIAYVSGWVDDGNPARGELTVSDEPVPRVAGRVYPSPNVRYRDIAGHIPGAMHDYVAEFDGIARLRAARLAEVELHGFTHMRPDLEEWAIAPDRYEAERWFRELGSAAELIHATRPTDEHPLARGMRILRALFNTQPTTLICPGEQWTNRALERALDLGLQLVGSYYFALRDGDRFCWCTHVCAPYLDQADAAWFDAGLPVVGYFHDRDLAVHGTHWLAEQLDRWRAAGARCFIHYRELAAALADPARSAFWQTTK